MRFTLTLALRLGAAAPWPYVTSDAFFSRETLRNPKPKDFQCDRLTVADLAMGCG